MTMHSLCSFIMKLSYQGAHACSRDPRTEIDWSRTIRFAVRFADQAVHGYKAQWLGSVGKRHLVTKYIEIVILSNLLWAKALDSTLYLLNREVVMRIFLLFLYTVEQKVIWSNENETISIKCNLDGDILSQDFSCCDFLKFWLIFILPCAWFRNRKCNEFEHIWNSHNALKSSKLWNWEWNYCNEIEACFWSIAVYNYFFIIDRLIYFHILELMITGSIGNFVHAQSTIGNLSKTKLSANCDYHNINGQNILKDKLHSDW